MTPTELLDEIMRGPLAAELAQPLAEWDDVTICQALNRKDIPTYNAVTPDDFMTWAASTGQRAVIEDTANAVNDPLRAVALTLRDLLVTRTPLNLGANSVQFMAENWVALGKCSRAAMDSLFALGARTVSRAEQLKVGITQTDVVRALWNDDGTRRSL